MVSNVDSRFLTSESPEFYFWLRHARRSQEPVVELFAGRGRVAVPLAEQAIQLIAVEPDEQERREGVRQSKDLPIRWMAGTPLTFTLERRAGMVFLAGKSFEQLLTLDGQRAALRNIYANLQIGGKLAVDLAMPQIEQIAANSRLGSPPRPLAPIVDGEVGSTIYRWISERYDPGAQHVSRHLIYEMVDETGTTLRRWHRTLERAFIWPREMQLLLEVTGFEVEVLYGGWNDEPFTADANQQIWLARKGV
ncbi:MAG: hypothetical protein M3220_05475 [Chloroflexota bacterium]|nr:hypothetical protein [Chloroflexota bacterium]